MRFSELPEPTKRILFLGMVVLGVITLIAVGLSSLSDLSRPPAPNQKSAPSYKNVSPFLFGTNLFLSPEQQQALPSPQIGHLLQSMHVRIVRVTFPEQPSQASLQSMARYVKSINAVPLVPLHGPLYSQARSDNTLVVQTMSQVFGKTTVYYEYGDEEDAVGVSADHYTTAWNATIPQLKLIAPNGNFIGPVTYRYDPEYLRIFLQKAHPLPDEVSWHEFTCDSSWSQQQCLQGVSDWSKHLTSARSIMKTISGTSLPIMITEWNYAANARENDGKSNDKVFLTNWTKNALQTLAANQVFGSMQYSGIKTSAPFNNSDQITTQGQVMGTLYEQFFAQGAPSNPTPTGTDDVTVTPTPTNTPTVTPSPMATPTPVVTATNTPIVSPTSPVGGPPPASPTPTVPVVIPTPTATPVPTATPTPTPVAVAQPTTTVQPTMVTTPPVVSTPGTAPTPTTVPTVVATPQPTIDATATAIADNKTPLYRLYSSKYANHFYTISTTDRDNAIAQNSYQSEGIAAYVLKNQVAGSTPLYWLYNIQVGDDFYTTSVEERDNAINKYGYQNQGIAGYVFTSQVKNSIPFYRLYNSQQGDHFYTTSAEERDNAVAKYGYQFEGIACYVFGS